MIPRRQPSAVASVSRRSTALLLPAALFALTIAAVLSVRSPAAPGSAPSLSLVASHWTMNVSDRFHRHVRHGLGRAAVGGRYVSHIRAALAVSPGTGRIGPLAPGASAEVTLKAAHALDEVTKVRFTVPRLAARGGGTYVSLLMRRTSSGAAYLARLRVGAGGILRVSLSKLIRGTEVMLRNEIALPWRARAGHDIIAEGFVNGGLHPTLGVRAWLVGHGATPWQSVAIDQTGATLPRAGGVGLHVYQSSTSPTGEVLVRALHGWRGIPARLPATSQSSSSSSSSTSAPASSASSGSGVPVSSDPATGIPTSASSSASVTSSSSSADPSSSGPAPSASSTSAAAPSTSTAPPSSTPPSGTPGPDTAATVIATAGAAPLGTATYSIPSDAVYVAPNGSDSQGSGSQSAPFASISRAISAAPTNGTVVLRGGSYNQDVFVSKAVTVEAYPGEVVWMDGSIPVNGWTPVGSTWVHSGWPYSFDNSASFDQGSNAGGYVNSAHPLAAYPDQVFADGVQYDQVAANPGPNQFSVDYTAHTITVGSNPAGKQIRASNLQQAFVVAAGHVTLRGFGVRRYATSLPLMGTVFFGGSVGYDLVQNLVIRDNATQGLSVGTTNVTVDHVESSANGMTGMHASHANGLVIEHSLITGNNTQHFNSGPSAAGIKVGRMDGVTIDSNYVHDNIGIDPIWTDENVTHFTITNNVAVATGAEYGIITELSDTGTIAGNTVSDAWYGYTAFDTGHVRIYNNTFYNNSVWDIGGSQDNRYLPGMSTATVNPTAACPWVVDYLDVANNDVSRSSAMYEFYALDKQTGRTADQMHITLHGNLFLARTGSSGPWAIGWGNGDPYTPTNFASPQAFSTAKGLPLLNASITTAHPAVPDMSNLLVPDPPDIANMLQVAAGTKHLGAY